MTMGGLRLYVAGDDDAQFVQDLRNQDGQWFTTVAPAHDARRQLAFQHELEKRADRYLFVAYEDGQRVGTVQLDGIDYRNGVAEICGTIVPKELRGRGIGLRMQDAAARIAFNVLRLQKVTGFVDSKNVSQLRCCEKLGYVYEGTLRRAMFVDGEYRDIVALGMLAEEWNASRGEQA